MKRYAKIFVSCLLTFTMVFTSVQWSAIVHETTVVGAAETVPKEKKEVVEEENTKDSTTFQMEDGKKQTVFYGQDVRFEDKNGDLQEYDPSLVRVTESKSEQGEDLKDYQYENKEGDKKHYLPKDLSEETPVLMENGKYQISFAPIYGQETKNEEEKKTENPGTDSVEDAVSQAEEAVRSISTDGSSEKETAEDTEDALTSVKELDRQAIEDLPVEDAQGKKEEKPVKVSYESQKKECTFSYQSLNMGIKESIVLTKAPEGNVLKFRFQAKGLVPKKNILDGGISFLDEKTEDLVATLEAPNMNDHTGKAYSEKLSYDIEPDGGEDSYLLTLHLDEDYFQDKDRQYPVTIDPTVTWTGSTDFWDVYVINGSYKNTNFYDNGVTVMMAGKSKQGVCRTYLRFKDFTAKIKGKYVDSATLTMYETGSSQSGQTIEARRVTENWTRPGLKWSNRPGYSTNYGNVKTTGTAKKARSINLTEYARQCASGKITSYGVMLKNADETKSYGQFYSSRASSNRPKMSVTYYDGPTTASSVSVTPQYANNNHQKTLHVNWAGISSHSLNRVEYRIANWGNGEETGDYVSYSSSTKIGTSGNGSADIDCSTMPEGHYKLVVRGVDNGYIAGWGAAAWFTIDRTAPEAGDISFEEGNDESEPSGSLNPRLEVGIVDENASYFKYRLEGTSTYHESARADEDGYAYANVSIPADSMTGRTEYQVYVIVVDKAGNESGETKVSYYYTDASKAQDYAPTNVKVRKSYGKNVIYWDKRELTDSIYYAVYRGESADFTPDDSTLVRGAIKDSYCMDTRVGDGKSYYYKVQAQKLAMDGTINGKSTDALSEKVAQDTQEEYEKRLGSKDYRDSMEISTPNGTGSVEKSQGNLMYESTDFSIPSLLLNLELTRTYNSQSDKEGMLGKGWYDSFHKELYQLGDDLVFQDSDGTYLTYSPQKSRSVDVSYQNKETKDYALSFNTEDDVKRSSNGDQRAAAYARLQNAASENIFGSAISNKGNYRPGKKDDDSEDSGASEGEKEVITVSNVGNIHMKDGMTYAFDGNGEITKAEDSNGNYLIYQYDEKGRLYKVVSNLNKELVFTYYENGEQEDLLKKIDLADGTKVVYSYAEGKLTNVSHKNSGETASVDQTYAYGSNGKMSKIIDAKKNGYQIAYTGEKAERFIRPNGEYQQLSYGDGTTTVSSHKADGTKTAQDTMSFDKNTGKILKKKDANGIESSYSYDDGGKDGEQNGWVNEYLVRKIKTEVDYQELDAAGLVKFLKTDKEKEETKTVTSYDDHGQPTTVTTTKEGAPDSVEQTTYQDTVQGTTQTTTTTQGEEKETSVIKTDAMGRETENTSKDRKGNILSSTETSYDFMGRAIQTKVTSDGVTQTESKTYDDNGTVATETSASGIKTAYRYDSLNRVIKATESADGTDTVTETSYGYEDAQIHTLNGTKDYQDLSVQTTKTNGRVSEKSWTDAAGQTVRSFSHGLYTDHVFTSDGKEIATISLGTKTSGDGKIALQLYDKEGKQTAAIQNPEITKGTSDATVKVGNSSILQKTEYDTKGNETTKTDGNGDQISYAYDDQNRVTEITQGGQKTKVSYQVNSDGSTTTSVTDANGHVKQETASASGSVTTTSDLGDGSESITTKYTYDDRGNKISEVYANGAKKTYEYNSRNLVTKTQSYDKEGTKTLISRYRYDDYGQLLEMTDYRVSSETETAYRHTEYTYDQRGRITAFAEISQNAQPTADDIKAHQIRYTYNEDGNLSKVSYPTTKDGIQSLSYIYDENGWLQEIKGELHSKGQTTEKVLRSYTYDTFGRLVKTVTTDYKKNDQTKTITYTYDNVGNRLKEDDGTTTTSYTYNGLDQLKTSTKKKELR